MCPLLSPFFISSSVSLVPILQFLNSGKPAFNNTFIRCQMSKKDNKKRGFPHGKSGRMVCVSHTSLLIKHFSTLPRINNFMWCVHDKCWVKQNKTCIYLMVCNQTNCCCGQRHLWNLSQWPYYKENNICLCFIVVQVTTPVCWLTESKFCHFKFVLFVHIKARKNAIWTQSQSALDVLSHWQNWTTEMLSLCKCFFLYVYKLS